MKNIYILSLLVAVVHSQMDMEFCNRFKPTFKHSYKLVTEPPIYPDFFTSLEVTNDTDNGVAVADIWYSQTADLFQRKVSNNDTRQFMILHPKKNTILISLYTIGHGTDCGVAPFSSSFFYKVFNVEDTKLHLPAVRDMLPASKITTPIYLGKSTVRGIPAEKWFICGYSEINATLAGEVYYSDDGITMPGTLGKAPLALTFNLKTGGNVATIGRYDFAMFVDRVDPKDKALERPTGMFCKNGTIANRDMPKPVDSCQFECMMKELGDTKAIHRTTPTVKYFKDVYDPEFSIFLLDQESVGSEVSTAFRWRLVHDFNSGLEYDMNLFTGSCTVQNISTEEADFNKDALGFVELRKPNKFFNLKNNEFQYMGKHRDFDRDIDADVYTAMMTESVKCTLWVPSAEFLKQMGFRRNELVPLRYRMEGKKGDSLVTKEGDIFSFSTKIRQADLFPDLSPCYSAGKEIYVDIVLKGHFKLVYSRNPDNFQAAFGTAMMTYSGILSPIRMASFRVSPEDEGYTLVQFTLLDKPSITGNSETEVPEPGNDVVWPKLKQSLDTSQFQVSVHNDLGHHIAKAVSYRKDFQDPTTFNAKKANLKAISDQSSRYGEGPMAGVGIGMLLLGLLAGFCFMKSVKRYTDKVPGHFGMQEFKNDA